MVSDHDKTMVWAQTMAQKTRVAYVKKQTKQLGSSIALAMVVVSLGIWQPWQNKTAPNIGALRNDFIEIQVEKTYLQVSSEYDTVSSAYETPAWEL